MKKCKGCDRQPCEGCNGFGMRLNSENRNTPPAPEGWMWLERCDCCQAVVDDFSAALEYAMSHKSFRGSLEDFLEQDEHGVRVKVSAPHDSPRVQLFEDALTAAQLLQQIRSGAESEALAEAVDKYIKRWLPDLN